MTVARLDSPLKLAASYCAGGLLWILASDGLLAWWSGEGLPAWGADVGKGALFILVTTGLLYGLSKRLVHGHIVTEEALRESQLRWQFALEGAGDGLWDWNPVSNRVFYSRQWKSMLGYAEHEIGDSLTEWEERVHPDDLTEARNEIARYFRGETPVYRSEHRLRTKDGSYKWILDRGQIISRTPDGKPSRVIGTHADITERKNAQAQVTAALNFGHAVLRSAPHGVMVYGADGRTLLANETAARIVGTDVAGLLRQNFRELPSWREHGLLALAEQALASGEQVVHTGALVTTFGRSLWVDVRFVPFEHMQSKHLLLILSDETEKRRTQEKLHLMHAAMQAAPVGWLLASAEGEIEWVNPAFTALTGYTLEEVLGRNPRFMKSGRQTPEFYADLWATIKSGKTWSGELRNVRKDGGVYSEHMTVAPVRNIQGKIAHFVAIKKDITERKQLEEQLARAQRLESIGMLASGIAHDLNNIFAPILLSLELLKLKYPTTDARRLIETVESAGQRGAGIVRQVLTFARGIEGERTEVQPKYLVKEAAQILGETLPRNIRIETSLPAGLPAVMGDATQLHQVLLNLAINARDAMPEGGRLVLGARADALDAVQAERKPPLKPGPYLIFTVTDTGSGIPPEVLEHIFEPFFTTKPLGKGTGLGLSTVYGIVRSHGGIVEVNTQMGQGTEFCIWLPAIATSPARPEPVAIQPRGLMGHGRKLLVVDDEEIIRAVTAEALRRHGFVVEVAADGLQALEIFRQQQGFAAVLTDLMMPAMNGYQLAREIRRLDLRIPILASSGMTGEAGHQGPEAGLAALGVRTLLLKPYTENTLLQGLFRELDQVDVQKKD